MSRILPLALIAVLVISATVAGCSRRGDSPSGPENRTVPAEYRALYANLKADLDRYNATLAGRDTGERYPVTFGAEVLPANANRGEDLLTGQALPGVRLYLDRLKGMGVEGATVQIAYPVYTPDFPRYSEYVAFYRKVAGEVRARGMKLHVKAGVVFAGTEFSPVRTDYRGLTFEGYVREKKEMIAAIIRDLGPDSLQIGAEPDTEYGLTGMEELESPDKYTDYIRSVLDGLDRGTTRVGAGIGTWGNIEYVEKFAGETELDFIAIHVYPVFGNTLPAIGTVAGIARQNNKSVVMDEAWLYKADRPGAAGVAATAEIFRRDAFSFWEPLDEQFLATMVRAARQENIEYLSPFWTTYFFAYVDHSPALERLSYRSLVAEVNREAAASLAAGHLTETGEYYRDLIARNRE